MYINNRIKKIIITVVVIFFILTIAVFQFNQNKNYNATKNELLTQTNTGTSEFENEYKLKVISDLQTINDLIPNTEEEIKRIEENLRIQRLTRRCLEYELERITTNKGYSPGFCDNKDNLEQFKVTSQAQTAQTQPKIETVVF